MVNPSLAHQKPTDTRVEVVGSENALADNTITTVKKFLAQSLL
jgi:hypothetical protein